MSSRDDVLAKTYDDDDLPPTQHKELLANVDDNDKHSGQSKSPHDESDSFNERSVDLEKQSASHVSDNISELPKVQFSTRTLIPTSLIFVAKLQKLKKLLLIVKALLYFLIYQRELKNYRMRDFCQILVILSFHHRRQKQSSIELSLLRNILPHKILVERKGNPKFLIHLLIPNVKSLRFTMQNRGLTSEAWILEILFCCFVDLNTMNKVGTISYYLYSLIRFLLSSISRVGLNIALAASMVMTLHAVGSSSIEILKQRRNCKLDFFVIIIVLDLVYWRDPKKSSAALLLSLTVITIFARYSVLSVISYAGLAVLAGTLGYRLFKTVEGHIKKTNGDNPFHEYLAQDWSLPQERVHAQVDVLVEHGIKIANQLKRLVFIENIVDSTKFGLLLWSVTYIASWFSGYALAILFVLGMFTIPKVYETYEEPIDAHFATINDHVKNVLHLIETKLPFLRKTQVETEKKDQ
uniref:Reticulon-like protein n=1 Tax=Heterorhabditis bacteriophora TaxID=37862 RepID=A0A1I7XV50_HETBA